MSGHGSAYGGGGGGGGGGGRPKRAAAAAGAERRRAAAAEAARLDRYIDHHRPPYYNRDGSVNKYYQREGYGK